MSGSVGGGDNNWWESEKTRGRGRVYMGRGNVHLYFEQTSRVFTPRLAVSSICLCFSGFHVLCTPRQLTLKGVHASPLLSF